MDSIKSSIIFALILLLNPYWLVFAEKIKVCTITINSDNEAKAFTKHLSTGANKGKFEIVELTTLNKSNDNWDWFNKACEINPNCKVLIISGHFAASFFSDNNSLTLTMDELEKHSCNSSCDGIIKDPSEVFLFGCNTLAGKDADHRTADEYLEVLLEHGMDLDRAVQSVQGRYGALGNSNRDTMKRIFKGVKNIYGFSSTGPLGHQAEPLLKNYFKKVKDYEQHLLEIETRRALAMLNETNKKLDNWVSDNEALAKAFSSQNFYQCPGIHPGDDNIIMQNICKIKDDNANTADTISLINELLTGKDALLYAPTIINFFERSRSASYKGANLEAFNQIKINQAAKKNILGGISTLDPVSQLSHFNFLVTMGWKTKEEISKMEKKTIMDLLTPPVTVFNRDSICGYYQDFYEGSGKNAFYKMTFDDLPKRIFNDSNGIFTLGCMNIRDKRLTKVLEKKYHQYKNAKKERKMYYFRTLASAGHPSKILDKFILRSLSGKDKEMRSAAAYFAGLNQSSNLKIQKKMLDLLEKDSDEFQGYSVSRMKITDQSLIERVAKLIQNKKGTLSLFPTVLPLDQKLGDKATDFKQSILRFDNERLNNLVYRTDFMNKFSAEFKIDLLIEAASRGMYGNHTIIEGFSDEENVKFSKALNEKMAKSEKFNLELAQLFSSEIKLEQRNLEPAIRTLEHFADSVWQVNVLLERLGDNIEIPEELLERYFKNIYRKGQGYPVWVPIHNNIRPNSKVHGLMVEHIKENHSISSQEMSMILEYEKLRPTRDGQEVLLEWYYAYDKSEEIDKLFEEKGFLDPSLKGRHEEIKRGQKQIQ